MKKSAAFITSVMMGINLYSGDIIVTATRTARDVSDVPASTTVISRNAIVHLAARNVDDVLKYVSGLAVLQPTGMGYGLPSQINIRGVPGQNGTMLLVDGMPLNEAGTGYVNMNEVSLDDIQSIEVVKGAFSSLYGADAFGGVINIITRNPDGFSSEANVSAGNEGYTRVSVQTGAGSESMGYIASYSRRTMDNYLARETQIISRWNPAISQFSDVEIDAENFDYEDNHAMCKFMMDIREKSHIDIHFRYFASELGYGQTDIRPLYPVAEDSTMQTRSTLVGAVLETELSGDTTARVRAFYRDQDRELWGLNYSHQIRVFPVYVQSYSETINNDWRIDTEIIKELGEKNLLTIGADFYRNDYDFSPVRNNVDKTALPASVGIAGDIENIGVYLQDEYGVTEKLNIVAGVRGDSHTEFSDELSPKAGVNYKLSDETTMRASVGRGYRAPSAVELFQPAIYFGSIIYDSNTDLNPEYIVTSDIGLDQAIGDSVRAKLDFFYNDMKDLISKQINGNELSFANVSEAWSAGSEMGIDWCVVDSLKIFLNYTYQQSENQTTGDDLEHIPEHMGGFGMAFEKNVKDWHAALSVMENYRGRRGYIDISTGMWNELDGYWRTDATLRFNRGDSMYVAINVQNLMDQEYQEWDLINPGPGRLYALEIGASY